VVACSLCGFFCLLLFLLTDGYGVLGRSHKKAERQTAQRGAEAPL
jgi:hypothetical protein